MLHEILLSLSGLPSPIWDELKHKQYDDLDGDKSFGSYTSAAERAMLQILAELVDLHIKLREATAQVSRSHPSPTCRAVSNRIKTNHLRAFTDKIIEVETLVLQEDAKYVGAYKIVPLSTIVTEFQPWARPLRWLWKTITVLQPAGGDNKNTNCSAAVALDFLRKEGHTGYTDIKDIAGDLLVAAQQAWMQSLTPWLLYGQLPKYGVNDFVVSQSLSQSSLDYSVNNELVPYFVTEEAAEAVLAVGRALNQIKSRGHSLQRSGVSSNVCTALLPTSLDQIKSLGYPLQTNAFADMVGSINDTISRTALTQLLPTSVILEFLLVVQDFVLFRNGEFSASLINQAERRLQAHQASANSAKPVRKLGKVENIAINEVETAVILQQTWSELAALVPEHEPDDQHRERAAAWLRMEISSSSVPIGTLLPNTTSLVIDLPSDSSLHIFLSGTDAKRYRDLSAYIISLHRAEAHLTKLWKMSAHRRCYPTPLGPPLSASQRGQQALKTRRLRENQRHKKLRTHWACVSQALFLLSEIGNYFHGEVMEKSWDHLHDWLDVDAFSRPGSSRLSSRPTTASSRQLPSELSATGSERLKRSLVRSRKEDPRTIARAHHKYVEALYHAVLLDNNSYISVLRELFTTVDHFVALFQRLQIIWQGLDLQQDEGITDAFSNYAKEEEELMTEMRRTNHTLTDQLHELVAAIHEAEKQRDMTDMTNGIASMGVAASRDDDFEPWRAKTLDRLLMKLDFLAVGKEDKFEDALVDAEDD